MPKTPCGAASGASASADGLDVVAIAPGDVVAAEDDEIGRSAHQRRHRVGDVVVRDPVGCDGRR